MHNPPSCAVLTLEQTIPTGGAAVCPNSTVELTCVAQNEILWRDLNTSMAQPAFYGINQTLMTGVFRTVLTDVSDNTLTSTATIDSVNVSNDGIRISCQDDMGQTNERIVSVHVEGTCMYDTWE